MSESQSKNNIKVLIDNLLLVDFFLVLIFVIYFIFAILMQLKGIYIFIEYFRKLWNPIIVPSISILIFSSLIIGINSWWKQREHSQEEDI